MSRATALKLAERFMAAGAPAARPCYENGRCLLEVTYAIQSWIHFTTRFTTRAEALDFLSHCRWTTVDA